MTNRIDQLFENLREKKQRAFVAYIVAGDPFMEKTVEIVLALAGAGADVIELGVPFSDPLADGPVNQVGAQRALEAGTTPQTVLEIVRRVREKSQIPLVLFSYYNPLHAQGFSKYLDEAEKAGVDGFLIVDLPMEEARKHWPKESSLRLISLIAPTTPPDRVGTIVAQSSGFIYYVSREGVTGMQASLAQNLSSQVGAIRQKTSLPVCVGFGISTPDQAKAVAAIADGVVVGSAIVNEIGKHGKSPELISRVKEFASALARGVKG